MADERLAKPRTAAERAAENFMMIFRDLEMTNCLSGVNV